MDLIQEKLGRVRFDHQLWMNEMVFALKEIEIFESRLLHLIEQFTSAEEAMQLEVFLHEFDLARKSITTLQSHVQKHLISMKHKIQSNGHLESITDSQHQETEKQLESFRNYFAELKVRFHEFGALQG